MAGGGVASGLGCGVARGDGGSPTGAAGVATGLGRGVGRGLGVVVVVVGAVIVVDVARGDGIGLGLGAITALGAARGLAARGLMSPPLVPRPGLADGEAVPSGDSVSSRPRGPCIIMRTSAVSRAAAITLAAQATITLFLRSRKRRRECEVVWPP